MTVARWFSGLVFASIAGCGGSHEISAPRAPDYSRMISATGPLVLFGLAGNAPTDLPGVRVTRVDTKQPLAGVTVTFTVMGSQEKNFSIVTDSAGIARLASFKVEPTVGTRSSVFATVDGVVGAVTFVSVALPKAPVAIFDLQSIGGSALPWSFSDFNDTYTVTEGRFLLFADDTYSFGRDLLSGNIGPDQVNRFFHVNEQTLDFDTGPLTGAMAGCCDPFAIGVFRGDTMTVNYVNENIFWDEAYLLRH